MSAFNLNSYTSTDPYGSVFVTKTVKEPYLTLNDDSIDVSGSPATTIESITGSTAGLSSVTDTSSVLLLTVESELGIVNSTYA